jgi:hypothetical protein
VRLEAPVKSSARVHVGYGRFETKVLRSLPNGETVEGHSRFFASCWCGAHAEFRKVEGHYSAVKKCDARCLAAKGNCCECSCAGANHGAGWGV